MLNLASEKEIQTNEKINTFEKCRRIETSFYKYLAMKPNISKYMPNNTAYIRHIVSRPSQVLSVYKRETGSVLHITIDSGATVSIIIEKAAKRCGFTISRASQTACQADGYSQLQVVGEIHSTVTRDKVIMPFEALVVKQGHYHAR